MDVAAASPLFRSTLWRVPPPAEALLVAAAAGGARYPQARDLAWTAAVASGAQAVLGGALGRALERVLLRSFGGAARDVEEWAIAGADALEDAYVGARPGLPNVNAAKALAAQLGRRLEEVQGWFVARQRRDRARVKLRRTVESVRRLVLYGLCVGWNVGVLRQEGWRWWKDLASCWEGLPLQELDQGVRAFYVYLEIPMYVVLLIAQLTDSRRASDMWEMTMHHSIVILLLSVVYLGNFVRIGMIGLLLHDVTDVFLECSKLANAFRYRWLADLMFIGFVGSWFYARLYKFATTVLISIYVDGHVHVGPVLNLLGALILMLVIMNLYWFTKIWKVAYRILWSGNKSRQQQREFTDLSTDDDVDSDSSFWSDAEPLKAHED